MVEQIPSNNDSSSSNDNRKFSNWLRILELGLGATAIILLVITLTYPGITTQTIIRITAIVLLIIGFERIAVGIILALHNKSILLANLGLGPLIIALAIVIIVFSLSSSRPPIALGELALLFNGISKIQQGVIVKETRAWSKTLLLGVGGLNIFVSALALMTPSGESTLARSISFTLLITGIQIMTSAMGIKKDHRKSQVSMR